MKYRFSALLTALVLLTISGCSTVSYYTQSVVGHSRLMLARTPLEKARSKADQNRDSKLVRQLNLAQELRAFAVKELGLPDNKSYKNYVALKRDYPVWVGVAAPEFSLEPKQWCYPIIGCASYRGYFRQAAAERYFAKLNQQGYEVSLGGVAAYSTLGWFADPILSSMLLGGDLEFAETLFHELAHQVLYVNGDSGFNEAFATVVSERGVLRWLRFSGDENAEQRISDYQQRLVALDDFNGLLEQFKVELASVYSSDLDEPAMRVAKQQLLAELPVRYQTLKQERWNNKPWFDYWFERPANNARLAALATYRAQVPALNTLLGQCNNDLVRFYDVLGKADMLNNLVQIPKQCDQ